MPNVQGVVKQFYPNNGKPAILLDDGTRYGAFKADQIENVKAGDTVAFSFESSTTNGKTYNNIRGKVAIVASNADGSAPPNSAAQQGGIRRGEQIGASIYQAIAALPVLGIEPTMENLEDLAKGLLRMSDRLAAFKD